jgi:hypothetical protein
MKRNMNYLIFPKNICKFKSDSFEERQNLLSSSGVCNKYVFFIDFNYSVSYKSKDFTNIVGKLGNIIQI